MASETLGQQRLKNSSTGKLKGMSSSSTLQHTPEFDVIASYDVLSLMNGSI
ncbi:MAG: hypothetical protein V7661_01635 [Sulfitobacter sp.]